LTVQRLILIFSDWSQSLGICLPINCGYQQRNYLDKLVELQLPILYDLFTAIRKAHHQLLFIIVSNQTASFLLASLQLSISRWTGCIRRNCF
jgi:hypothetical protein